MDQSITIEGVSFRNLKIFKDERGQVMHMLRSDSKEFEGFGEIYFSITNPKVIKGWKRHLKKNQLLTVPVGTVKFVILDQREESPTHGHVNEIIIGEENYGLLRIPNNLTYAFQTTSDSPSLIANCTDHPHEDKEALVFELGEFNSQYIWE